MNLIFYSFAGGLGPQAPSSYANEFAIHLSLMRRLFCKVDFHKALFVSTSFIQKQRVDLVDLNDVMTMIRL